MIPITQLDDAMAERILAAIVLDYSDSSEEEVYDTPELRSALAEFFGVEPILPSASSGELARQALQLLANDPNWLQTIEFVSARQASDYKHTFDGASGIALTAAVLFALRTELEITRDKFGKWTFKLKSRSIGNSALKPIVEKLISYLPK